MNKNAGYISLYRSIQTNFLWDDKPFARGQAWIDLLLKASYEKREIIFNGQYVKLEEGELITSINKLADAWGWSRGKVVRFLDSLKNASMVSYQTDNHKTTVKVLNFKEFQACSKIKRATDEQQTGSTRTTNRQQADTYNNYNKYNNLNNYSSVSKSKTKSKPDYSDPDHYKTEKKGSINDVFK